MTKRDYVLIATAINSVLESGGDQKTLRDVMNKIAEFAREQNPAFNSVRFAIACGMLFELA